VAIDDRSTVRVDFDVEPGTDGPKIKVRCSDRTSAVRLAQLLPALQALTDEVVDAAVEREHSAGREISCKAGCGACCRQLVPISGTEARELPKLMATLGDAHRERVVARFDEVIARLRASRLWDRLQRYATLCFEERMALGPNIFSSGLPALFWRTNRVRFIPTGR
jgi:hypothetical protein